MEKTKSQVKVFVVKCEKTTLSYYNPDLLDNNSFIKIATQQNGVYTLREFSTKFNSNLSLFSPKHKIRFINVIAKL